MKKKWLNQRIVFYAEKCDFLFILLNQSGLDILKSMSEAKTSQAVLDQVKFSYMSGDFKNISELAVRFGLNNKTLHSRIDREEWEKEREEYLRSIQKKAVKVGVDSWVEMVKDRSKKDWDIIDRSIDNIGSEVDPDTMLTSVKARKILDDMVRRSYGLSDSLDVRSGGQSIGESLVSALQKLRETDKTPPLTNEEVDRIIEAEIIDEKPK